MSTADMTAPTREELHMLHDLRSANVARQAEWDSDNQISLSFRGNELAGEVGEACNVIKKLERERLGIRGSRATKEQLADELADVVICADLIAMQEGIDLFHESIPAKFNATSEKMGLRTRLAAREPAVAAEAEPVAWLVKWTDEVFEWVHAHANEVTAVDQAREKNGKVTPLYAAPPSGEPAVVTTQFLPAEDGEFNGNVEPIDDRIPIAAIEGREVDWVDVTGWGVFKGHAIPVDVARHIAEKINFYHAYRTPPSGEVERLAAENKLLRAALEWYANPDIYKPHPHGPAFDLRDLSFKARAALADGEER